MTQCNEKYLEFSSINILLIRADLSGIVLYDDPAEGGDGAGDELEVGPVLGLPLKRQSQIRTSQK